MKRFAFLIIAIFLTWGCRSAPIYNVIDAPLDSPAKMHEIEIAIQRAGSALRWNMKVDKPGLIAATLFLRGHMAAVEITYDTKTFSITYKDSMSLNYDGKRIHENYNSWIRNLERRIRLEVSKV